MCEYLVRVSEYIFKDKACSSLSEIAYCLTLKLVDNKQSHHYNIVSIYSEIITFVAQTHIAIEITRKNKTMAYRFTKTRWSLTYEWIQESIALIRRIILHCK